MDYSSDRRKGQDKAALDYPEHLRPLFVWARNAKDDPRRKELGIDWLILKAKKALEFWPNSHVNEEEGLDINNLLSLDQIVPSAGYTEDNVDVVPLWYNKAKSNSNKEEFIETLLQTAKVLEEETKNSCHP